MIPTKREQQLVDLCFSIALLLSESNGKDSEGNEITLYKLPVPEKAEWIAKQLAACGFPTHPCGASWGVLDRSEDLRGLFVKQPSQIREHDYHENTVYVKGQADGPII